MATITSPAPRTWESRRDIGGQDWGARLNQLIGSVGLVQLQAAQHKDRYQLKPSGAGSGIRYNDFTCDGGTPTSPCDVPVVANSTTGGFGSIFGPTVNNDSKRMMYKGDFTFYLGNNEVKAGGDYQKGTTNATTYYTGIGEGGYPGGQLVQTINEYGQNYYQHNFFAPCADRTDPSCQTPINNVISPNSEDLGWYIQDSFKVMPSFTINAGLRWDKEDVNDYTGATAFSTTNEWQPRIGVIWDPNADGQMKIYAFYGRFYYSLPTDLNVRAYGAQTGGTTYNFDPVDSDAGPDRHRPRDPVLPGRRVHRAGAAGPEGHLPGRSVGRLRHAARPELLGRRQGHVPQPRQHDRRPLRPRRLEPADELQHLRHHQPGLGQPARDSARIPGCNGLDGNSYGCFDTDRRRSTKAKRTYWGGELVARKQFTNALWAQASVVYSSLRATTTARSARAAARPTPASTPTSTTSSSSTTTRASSSWTCPGSFRLDATYTTPFKLYAGLTSTCSRALRSTSRATSTRDTAPRSSSSSAAPPRRSRALRDEPDARLPARPRPRDDHPADLHVQPPEQRSR